MQPFVASLRTLDGAVAHDLGISQTRTATNRDLDVSRAGASLYFAVWRFRGKKCFRPFLSPKTGQEAHLFRVEQCVFTDSEVTQCGGCLELGGTDCSSIPNSLATSCRQGTCKIRE